MILSQDVRETLGIPDLKEAQQLIAAHLDCTTELERQQKTPTLAQLEVFFLLHPEYGCLPERSVAELLHISRRALRDRLLALQKKIPTAVFEPLVNQHENMSTKDMLEFTPEMEDHVQIWF